MTKCLHVGAGLGPQATGAALQLHKDDVCGFLLELLLLNKRMKSSNVHLHFVHDTVCVWNQSVDGVTVSAARRRCVSSVTLSQVTAAQLRAPAPSGWGGQGLC